MRPLQASDLTDRETPGLSWVNTLLSNVKRTNDGTYHAYSSRYWGRYPAEFEYSHEARLVGAALVR